MDRFLIVIGALFVGVATLVSVLTLSPPLGATTSPANSALDEPLEPLPPLQLQDAGGSASSTDDLPAATPSPVPEPEPPSLPPESDRRIQLVTGGTSRLGWAFNSRSGWRAGTHAGHDGDDAYAIDWNRGSGNDDVGETVRSIATGRVIYARSGQGRVSDPNSFGYGNTVIVQLSADPSFAVRYAHLRHVMVTEGESVSVGESIGTVGASGLSGRLPYTAHLHLVLYQRLDEQPDPSDGCYSGKPRQRGIDWLRTGQTPCQLNHGKTKFAARFRLDSGIH